MFPHNLRNILASLSKIDSISHMYGLIDRVMHVVLSLMVMDSIVTEYFLFNEALG